MSKMSELYNEISEQVAELGFQSIEEAEEHGYVVDYLSMKLVKNTDLAEEAFESKKKNFMEEKNKLIQKLKEIKDCLDNNGNIKSYSKDIEDIIHFVEEIND